MAVGKLLPLREGLW